LAAFELDASRRDPPPSTLSAASFVRRSLGG
jgi:hypothetical protein